jgi:hypothetical protein
MDKRSKKYIYIQQQSGGVTQYDVIGLTWLQVAYVPCLAASVPTRRIN